MISPSTLRTAAAALALTSLATPAVGQFAPVPTPTADALAAQMRVLAGNPRDVFALIAAGELSVKLGDPAAALSFFGRAQAVDPSNARIVAGRANALVLLERPGEALRLYDQAERAGVPMTGYLAQRGLAYDLIGQPSYAQRDYRRALLTSRDSETVRRLALSLGISGKRDEAMTLLDPLLRASDRAAWRARACVLAISGDTAGAQKIATSMMPGGSALSPFFGRLQWLSPADRAFAVHFGEVKPSATRANDARLAPALAILPVDATPLPSAAPVTVSDRAVAEPARRDRGGGGRRQAAAVLAPTPGVVRPAPAQIPAKTAPVVASNLRPPSLPAGAQVASVTPRATPAPLSVASPAPRAAVASSGWAMTADSPASSVTPRAVSAAPAALVGTPSPTPQSEPVIQSPAAAPVGAARSAAVPTQSARPVEIATQSPAPAAAIVRTPAVAKRNTDMLASIISGISVPASELAVAAGRVRVPTAVGARSVAARSPTRTAEPAKAESKTKPDVKKPEPGKAEPARWWVQVAGGANASDLGKDWKRLASKSSAAFRGKTAWTTPLRATNRLLAGPFKSQSEASAFVNALAKDGASSFAWQSEAGQKIAKLGSE